MKKISILVSGFLMASPFMLLAANYSYLDNTGNWQNLEANSSSQALAVSSPNDIAHGGVILNNDGVLLSTPTLYGGALIFGTGAEYVSPVSSGSPSGNSGINNAQHTYEYVDVNGNMRTISASSEADARANATDADPHSGFIQTS